MNKRTGVVDLIVVIQHGTLIGVYCSFLGTRIRLHFAFYVRNY